ncbi:GAF domain-containing protein [Pseudanabaena sp. FACHB-2040]|uniref:GAF domain-containing protein n=1 Tax=Pseudanabaena sp. FACHB-2040 TaxID=2692859 RepID=UPI001685755E|nr:GAF domain-containing protein [Pseudanabaena sp. FACHB-2040]MBD2259266.1 GAF domain-containing protein [Pseudanabaena sp. FACHB-2040]
MVQAFSNGADMRRAANVPTTIEEEPCPSLEPAAALQGADWLALIEQRSRLAIALLEVKSDRASGQLQHSVLFATETCRRLLAYPPGTTTPLLEHLSPTDQAALLQRLRLQILNGILQYHYGEVNLVDERLMREPVIVSLRKPESDQKRQLELRLQSAFPGGSPLETPLIRSISDSLLSRLGACWPAPPDRQGVTAQLLTPGSPLALLLETLDPKDYEASGYLLLEGWNVTERELASSLVQLLVSRDSVLEPLKFGRANALMKQLFRADGSLILSAENDQVTLFMGLEKPEWDVQTYPVQMLQQSSFFNGSGRVLNIPDLSLNCTTDCARHILETGVRSLLIIPLVIKSAALKAESRHLLGLVGVTSRHPYAFTQVDCDQAARLIPSLTAALRHTVQDRFTNIHSAVRWRFEQEAERRSWGLPPEPIVFENVYPLYGISDVRGSSEERNRAIQADLLTQFRLALAVVDALCEKGDNAFASQFRVDLVEHIQELEGGITVDAEVTLVRYLQDTLEGYFEFFASCSPTARQAVEAYQAALNPAHGCVYAARALYDQTINQINLLLRDTWNRWQQTMQGITRHYCDIEATDGIDHMIYAGRSIDPQFTPFHLRSLRYEQMRAVCDCARAASTLKDNSHTHLEVTHLVLVQAATVDITHDENTERLFDVRGTRDTRYEIVKKRIDKACEAETRDRITQPGMLTVVYSTEEEWQEYQQYLRYLHREGWVESTIIQGNVEPMQGVSGLKFARVKVLPEGLVS